MTDQAREPLEHSAQSSAIAQLKHQTRGCQQTLAKSRMYHHLLSDTLTERSYFQALEVWVQCWRTLEMLEQLYRPENSSIRNTPTERYSSARADLLALNTHFNYTATVPGREDTLGAPFPFWSKNKVDWYGLVYAMRSLTATFAAIEQHLSKHFSDSITGAYQSFFHTQQLTKTQSRAEVNLWNEWLSGSITTDAEINASITTATEILFWLNSCLQGFDITAEPVC